MQIISAFFNQFHSLSISIQQRIEENCATIYFERNDNIDIIGKTPEHFLLIKSGVVKSIYQVSNRLIITGFKGPGDALFHVSSLFDDTVAREGFKVVNQVEAIVLPYKVIQEIHSRYPEFLIHLLKLVDIKLLDLRRHAQMLSETADRRIFSCAKYFSHILADIPKQQLCQFLCISRTTFYFYGKILYPN
ncbi:Crp/Fnr family transcriptional regulator [Puia sp. P3]|uniref:Crp/Fnr family transcriptional regulator n=1 Tax=Puia sp. P3 TaxID=3423952 RepID=UPI003D67AD37